MLVKKDLKKILCPQFCPYYKPNKNQELACMGYYVVESLLKKGHKVIFRKTGKTFCTKTKEKLKEKICTCCPFYERDCDFIQQKNNSSPCGGFILLGHLLESKTISFDDIINANRI